MEATFSHLQINVSSAASLAFYRRLLSLLGYKALYDSSLGMTDGKTSVWILRTEKRLLKNPFHRKNTGLNHIAFRVRTRKDVAAFLRKNRIPTLYSSPKAFPEYTPTYYAVYFEDPDRIKLEVCKE